MAPGETLARLRADHSAFEEFDDDLAGARGSGLSGSTLRSSICSEAAEPILRRRTRSPASFAVEPARVPAYAVRALTEEVLFTPAP
jgi:hypothetical protein